MDNAIQAASSMFNSLKQNFSDVGNAAGQTFQNISNTVGQDVQNVGNAVGGAWNTTTSDVGQAFNQIANPQNTPNLPIISGNGPSEVGNILQSGLDVLGKTPVISPVTMGSGLTYGDIGRFFQYDPNNPTDPMLGGASEFQPLEQAATHYGGQLLTKVGSGLVDVAQNLSHPAIQMALSSEEGFFGLGNNPATKLARTASLSAQAGEIDPARVDFYKQQFLNNPEQMTPIYVNKNTGNVVDGANRLQAARELGIAQVPTMELTPTPIDQVKSALQDQSGKIKLGFRKNELFPLGDTKGVEQDAAKTLDDLMPQIRENRANYDNPAYMGQTLLKQPDWNSFLDAHPEINNHGDEVAQIGKGPDAIRPLNGYIGYITTDKGTIPLDEQQASAIIDKRVVSQWTANNGDQDLAVLRKNPNFPTSYDVIDRHHGIPAARAIGLDKVPAIILHKDAPPLSMVYDALKKGEVDPITVTGGIPLDEQAASQLALKQSIGGEASLTPDRIAQLAPKYATDKGKAEVSSILDKASKNQEGFDTQLRQLAQDIGLNPQEDFESRVKQPDTFIQKIAQHRLEGDDTYDAKGVNDAYGARFIADTPSQKGQLISGINQMDRDGDLKILKQQQVTKDTYSAYHIDFVKNGVRGEVQIHDPNSLLESVVNHEIRANAGENPTGGLAAEKIANARASQAMEPQAAQALAQAEEKAQTAGETGPLEASAQEATSNLQPKQLSQSQRGSQPPIPLQKVDLNQPVRQVNPSVPIVSQLSPEVKETLKNAPVIEQGGRSNGGPNILNNLKPNYKPIDKDIQNLIRQSTGKYAYETNQALKESIPLTRYWEGQSKEDRLSFMQRMQSGIQQEDPGYQVLSEYYKSKFDNTYEIGQQVKPDLAYKDDYFTKSGVWANKDEAQAFYNKWVQDKLANTPGSFKQLTFPTIADGVKAGLALKETNPETIYLNNYLQVRKAQIMSDFQQTAQARGWDMTQAQKVIDRYMDPGFGGSNVYRNIRQVNNTLNSIDLGLSAFHVAGTSINASISKVSMGLNQLVTGHPIQALGSALRAPTAALEYAIRGNKIIGDAAKGNLTPDVQNIIDAGGRITPQVQYQGSGLEGAIRTTLDDWNNGRQVSSTLKAPLRVVGGAVNEMAKPIMEYWVPRLKNGALADLIETNLKNLPAGATPEEIQAVKAEASDSIDNRFGQLVQDNLFWNKAVKDSLGLVMRSPGWNIGTARELGLGARDLFDVQRLLSGKGFSDRAAYTLALPTTTALLGAAYMYLHTGQGPQSLVDYFYPQTGQTDPNTGKPERVGFPTYMKDVYSFFKNPSQTLLNKASPLLSDVKTQIQGTDYRGRPIYDQSADLGTQLRQRAAQEIMGHLPFTIQSGTNRLNPTIGSTLESIMGINKAPASVTGGYYDKKSEVYSTLSPDQKHIMDYLTLSSQNGGPSGKDKGVVLLKPQNDWAIDKLKAIQLAGNPKDLLWSKSHDQIKAYLAYQLETDPKLRAQILLRNPWIPSFAKQYADQVSQSVAQAKQKQATQNQGLTTQIGNALGVYNPQPTTPSAEFAQRPPTPQSQLTPQQVQVAAAYTALPQGSLQRQALLGQNPWLKDYWNQNQQYYQQNPTEATGPLADYLRSQGIDPNVQPQQNLFGGSSMRGLSSRLPIRGGTGSTGGTKAKNVAPSSSFMNKMLVGPTLGRGKMLAIHAAISQAKTKVPKVRFGGGLAGKVKGLSTKVSTPKIAQPKLQTIKMPPIQKVNLKNLGRGYHSPTYGKYTYQ